MYMGRQKHLDRRHFTCQKKYDGQIEIGGPCFVQLALKTVRVSEILYSVITSLNQSYSTIMGCGID